MISDIETLLSIITTSRFECVESILRQYNGTDWEKYVCINENNYNRIRICDNYVYDIYIITWNVNQNAPIHDHSDNGCWMKVLKGKLIENIYNHDLSLKQSNELLKNDIGFIKNDIGYHNIINSNNDVSVSIHIYDPPNYKTKTYQI